MKHESLTHSKYRLNGYERLFAVVLLVCILGCNSGDSRMDTQDQSAGLDEPVLFTELSVEQTGIDFINNIFEDGKINGLNYDYLYNGGGVAVGDINNDGKVDIYFTGNMVSNKLYINLGDFKFEDITRKAGVEAKDSWCGGVSMVDINDDGYLDIYVCRSFNKDKPELRKNLLYINNGDLTFTERAAEYGLNDRAYSVQAAWFDYDRDGDLDMYLANHLIKIRLTTALRRKESQSPDEDVRDKLYQNQGNGKFIEVSKSSGIYNYGCGLGVAVGDLNNDGWPDVYVANDYMEPDFYYVNNGDGTFTESLRDYFKHVSYFGMGSDIADYNNDGLVDLVVLDMVAEDNYRQKTMMSSMNTELFWSYVDYGWHYQYMRNSFQINNGNGYFSEVGQLAGISNTDWSWAVLLADFDNDGLKDMFISNGYRRDGRNVDYRNKLAEMEKEQGGVFRESQIDELLAMIPSEKLTNYFYKNIGDLAFEKKSQDYGFVTPSFSNGAAYADFDNDGDLDLVVNNLTDPAFIYRNNAIEELQNNYLRIELVGLSPNKHGIGASATLYVDGQIQYLEAYVSRGYQSCVESTLHFGLGDNTKVDELLIKWPDGTEQLLVNIGANRVIKVFQKDAVEPDNSNKIETTQLFADITTQTGVNYRHIENEFDDFLKETLLPHKMSQFGPKIASGDVNGDGYEDFYIGGAAGQTGALYINNGNSSFSHSTRQPFDSEKQCEDIGSLFFDADGDGDLDLYVVSGGNEFAVGSTDLQDRLYLNDGAGNFTRAENVLPEMFTSGSCVVANDYDNDGDLDLFVGGRLVPGRYTFAPRSYLLNNENGIFKDVTEEVAIGLLRPGMVTSAVWTDFDGDNDQDLIVVGEWMPLSFYENKEGRFEDITFDLGMENTTGWWNKIVSSDFDNDGDDDYVIGNLGLNYKYKATENEPLHVYCHDFDNSGSLDIVLGYYNYGECFPVRGRECSSNQMPFIKDKFKNYDAFGKATLEDVYGDALQSALQHHEAKMFESIYIINEGNNKFKLLPLPIEAQVSMVFGIIIEDFNGDGNEDVLLAGNFYVSEVETGRADAGIGLYLKGNGKGNFTPVKVRESGFFADRDVRDLALIKNYDDSGYSILVANNNDKMQIFLNGSLPGQNIVSVK